MRRMYSKAQIEKIVDEHVIETGVQSINGKTGNVTLKAEDIEVKNSLSVQDNLERIDLELEGVVDDIADLNDGKLDASKSAVSNVGGLVIPNSAPAEHKLVGIDTTNGQELIKIGNGLTLDGDTLKATGTGGVTLYRHNIMIEGGIAAHDTKIFLNIVSTKSDAYTFSTLLPEIAYSSLGATTEYNKLTVASGYSILQTGIGHNTQIIGLYRPTSTRIFAAGLYFNEGEPAEDNHEILQLHTLVTDTITQII